MKIGNILVVIVTRTSRRNNCGKSTEDFYNTNISFAYCFSNDCAYDIS